MRRADTTDRFQKMYEAYSGMVRGLVFRSTQDYALAEDICQETFLRLYRYRDCIEEQRVKPWLLVVARNLLRDHFRKGGQYREILEDKEEQFRDTPRSENSMDVYLDQLGKKEFRARVLESLREKNPDWYEVFILAEYLGVSRKLIACRMGIARSTVDAYIKKSRNWMKQRFEKEYEQL